MDSDSKWKEKYHNIYDKFVISNNNANRNFNKYRKAKEILKEKNILIDELKKQIENGFDRNDFDKHMENKNKKIAEAIEINQTLEEKIKELSHTVSQNDLKNKNLMIECENKIKIIQNHCKEEIQKKNKTIKELSVCVINDNDSSLKLQQKYKDGETKIFELLKQVKN